MKQSSIYLIVMMVVTFIIFLVVGLQTVFITQVIGGIELGFLILWVYLVVLPFTTLFKLMEK